MRAGAVYLTEDRKSKGLLLEETIATNLTLAALDKFQRGPLVDRAKESRALDEAIQRFDIRVGDKGLLAGQMSGGNQQKLLIAKMMQLNPQRRRHRRADARSRHRRQAADLSVHRRARGRRAGR